MKMLKYFHTLFLGLIITIFMGSVLYSDDKNVDADTLSLIFQARQANSFYDYKATDYFYHAALIADSDTVEILEEYLTFAIGRQNLPLSFTLAQKIIIKNPTHALANIIIAVNDIVNNEINGAIKHLTLNATSEISYNNLLLIALSGIDLFKKGNKQEFFDKNQDLLDFNSYLYLYLIGSYHAMIKDYPKALTDFDIINNISPAIDTILQQQYLYYAVNKTVSASFNDYLGDNFINKKQTLKYIKEIPAINEKTLISNFLLKVATLNPDAPNSILLTSDSFLLANIALMIDKNNDLAKIFIAQFYVSIGNYKDALAVYMSVNKNSYYFRIVTLSVIEILSSQKDTKNALFFLESSIPYDKSNPRLFLEMGHLYHKNKEYKKAILAYTQALYLSEKNDYTLGQWLSYYFRGISYNMSNNWKKAERDLLNAKDINAEDPLLVNYLAYSWIERNENIDVALQMLTRALEYDPDNPNILDSYAVGLLKSNDIENALIFAKKAFSISPYDPIIINNFADILWKNGNKEDAVYYWELAYKLDNNPDILNKINGNMPSYLN